MTQRERLEMALQRHGCAQVKTLTSGWTQWTVGDLFPYDNKREHYFFVGTTGFRHGTKRTLSFDWPKLRARLLAEPITAGADCPLT